MSRILHLIRTMSGAGAELVVQNLCLSISGGRHECSVCELVGQGERGRSLAAGGVHVHSLSPDGRLLSPGRLWWRLHRLLASRRFDLIHTHSTDALATACLCRLLRPRLRHVHTFHFGNYPNREPVHRRLEAAFLRFPDRLVAVGYRQADAIAETYRIDRGKLDVVWNGVRAQVGRDGDKVLQPYRRSGRLLIGTIGTLTNQKGHHDLLGVAARMKARHFDVAFLLVGDGPLRPELELKTRELGLEDRVFFLGWIPDAARTVLPFLDVFFQPSRWEAMSMVLLEAASAGLPIACTDVGEASLILENGISALIAAPGEIDGLADVLERLVVDPQLRRRLGCAARERFTGRFSADRMASGYEAIYAELLGQVGS